MESTLVIIKPNGVSGGLVGEIIHRYEIARLGLRAVQIRRLDEKSVSGFYAEHRGKPFYDDLVKFMASGPVVLIVVWGHSAVETVRQINGATDPADARPGTIRHDFAPNVGRNVVHASDSTASAAREIEYWFGELVDPPYEPRSFVCDA